MTEKKQTIKAGFTLVETMVALAVLLAAVAGPVALINRGLINTASAKNKLVALNLAQEGIELVRLVRENNVLCDVLNGATIWPWDEDVIAPNPPIGSTDPDPQNSINTTGVDEFLRMDVMNFSSTEPSDLSAMNCKAQDADPNIMIQTPNTPHDSNLPALQFETSGRNLGLYQYQTGTPTNFTRTIEVRSPPITNLPEQGIDSSLNGSMMDVTSTVTWQERGAQRSVTLQERLFNWR